MNNRLGICFLVLFLVMLSGAECAAHKITVFGYVDQGMVKTESTFSGGRVAKHCQLSVLNDGEPVLMGSTDDNGMLDFPVPEEQVGFEIIVSCGDGHRGAWRIEAEELGAPPVASSHTDSPPAERVTVPGAEDLRRIVREELAAELGPIKHQLGQLKQGSVSLADIMGGLGYFLGLAGLASYMRFRRDGR